MSDRARQTWICGGYGPAPDLPSGEDWDAAIANSRPPRKSQRMSLCHHPMGNIRRPHN